MSKRFIPLGLLFFALSFVVGSCIDAPDFDFTPEISNPTVNSYQTVDLLGNPNVDSVVLSIRFRDGDGDLGVAANERADTVEKYKEWGNYQLTMLRRMPNGQFQEVPSLINQRLFFFPLKSDNKAGPLEGTLDFSQAFFATGFFEKAVVKFRIRIRDRALRVSNAVETDTLTINLPKPF
ncbi:hypothetical protein [Tellurirhabdus bombi]|uniref:hypothetical protein n=1 Tax=Tellurirhabdus bombi TaxID=2907205 RepID=UPI001F20312D|nr:hypothetical protein [Tellurirhabdus bombi]